MISVAGILQVVSIGAIVPCHRGCRSSSTGRPRRCCPACRRRRGGRADGRRGVQPRRGGPRGQGDRAFHRGWGRRRDPGRGARGRAPPGARADGRMASDRACRRSLVPPSSERTSSAPVRNDAVSESIHWRDISTERCFVERGRVSRRCGDQQTVVADASGVIADARDDHDLRQPVLPCRDQRIQRVSFRRREVGQFRRPDFLFPSVVRIR